MRQRVTPFVVLALLCGGTAGAATYYVDTNHPSASDGNPGSETRPWKTLQHAADVVAAGDTVLVKDGVYAGFQTETAGTAASPITFRALGDAAIVNTRNPHTPHNINVEGGDYTIIDGFDVRNAPSRGIRVVVARGVVVRNCVVSNSATQNILTGYAPQVQIVDNVSFGTLDEHGIYVSNSTDPDDRPVIRGNVVYGNNTNGIQVNGDCYAGGDGTITGAVIEDNVVYGNGAKGLSIISMSNSTIRNNVIYHNAARGLGAGGIHLADEPDCGLPSSGNVVVNNTIVEHQIAGIRITQEGTGNVIFNNLIAAGSSTNAIVEDGASGNLIDSTSNLRYAYASLPTLFVDEAARDYHLRPTATAAINHGVAAYQGRTAPSADFEGQPRPAGGGFDIGADEVAAFPRLSVSDTTVVEGNP